MGRWKYIGSWWPPIIGESGWVTDWITVAVFVVCSGFTSWQPDKVFISEMGGHPTEVFRHIFLCSPNKTSENWGLEDEHWGLEDDVPVQSGDFQVSCLVFLGGVSAPPRISIRTSPNFQWKFRQFWTSKMPNQNPPEPNVSKNAEHCQQPKSRCSWWRFF